MRACILVAISYGMASAFAPPRPRIWRPRTTRLMTAELVEVLSEIKSPYDLSQDLDDQSFAAAKNWETFTRVIVPTSSAIVIGAVAYPLMSLGLKSVLDTGELSILGNDSSQFIQNFLSVNGLLYSILCGQSYYFMYQQTENLYHALYAEVSEAKSLLEQVSLICSGRPFFVDVLGQIQRYVKEDLKRIDYSPAVLLSSKPKDDPLESVLYLTSVGVPSVIYDTVRSLRQARAVRLAATQRKLPEVQFWLLYFLASLELLSFPLLGAGTSSLFTNSILVVQSVLFGCMAGSLTLSLVIIHELWTPVGGAYNVDMVLEVMVSGLEEETESRLAGANFAAPGASPSEKEPLDVVVCLKESEGIGERDTKGGFNPLRSLVNRF